MKAIAITPDLQIGSIDLEKPLHRSAGSFVGGLIEVVRPHGLQKPYVMIVNEEFMMLDLPVNKIGSWIYRTHLHGHPICGNIIIMQEDGEDLIGLDPLAVPLVIKELQELKEDLLEGGKR